MMHWICDESCCVTMEWSPGQPPPPPLCTRGVGIATATLPRAITPIPPPHRDVGDQSGRRFGAGSSFQTTLTDLLRKAPRAFL